MTEKNQGSVSVFVLMIGTVFSVLVGGVVLFGAMEFSNVRRTESRYNALSIAEAGIHYYRWHLAHNPNDFQDGIGEPGPYEHGYSDSVSGVAGKYSLEIIPPEVGSEIVTIKSTGWTDQYPGVRRTVTARFGPEPLTRFSFLHNANVWFGSGLTVYGEVLSNGGIRMDGTNESVVQSMKETYTCGSETGCSPSQTKPGVWGSGGPASLWEFPVPFFDFDSVVTDFNLMRQSAQDSGVYLPNSSNWGYHVVFNADGTASVYEVTVAGNRSGWSVENGCENLYQAINSQTLLGTYDLDDNRIIYAEDTVWVDGTVNGDATVVAARLPVGTYTTNMWINGNVVYSTTDGSDNLGLIAQNNIMYVRNLPNEFVINAAMMAQAGRIMRHHYNYWGCSSSSYARRDKLTIWGSVISNQKSYWNFSGWSGLQSGFYERDITFNQNAAEIPSPYFPATSDKGILSWEED